MKLPNSYGSVYRMPGNRRRPFRAVVTVGWEEKDGHAVQKRATVGYYATKAEALNALATYNKAPYDLVGISFSTVYEMWSAEHFPSISDSTAGQYKAAFAYCGKIYNSRMSDLKTRDLETVINECPKASLKQRIRLLFSQMYKYALRHEIVVKNYAALVELEPYKEQTSRSIFTDEEIIKLHENLNRTTALILLGIYSGWRPSELLTIKINDGFMYGGMKTEAGHRVVPVIPQIQELVDMYEPYANYSQYKTAFKKVMYELQMEHRPHDTRHTFATLCDRYNVRLEVTKQLMGHSLRDITQHYTHRNLETLKQEIGKIKVCYL